MVFFMKIKSLILIFLIIGVSIFSITDVNAITISQHDTERVIYHEGHLHLTHSKDIHCYKEHGKKCKYYGYSQKIIEIKGKPSELSNLRKIKVKVDGKKAKIYRYNNYKTKKTSISFNAFIKGNILGKRYTITAYDKHGKVMKTRKGKIAKTWKFPVSKKLKT